MGSDYYPNPIKGVKKLKEKFSKGVEVKLSKEDDTASKNKKRLEAIKQNFNEVPIEKETFLRYVRRNQLHKGKEDVLNRLNQLDFSQANPRNHTFMTELSFAGESIAEGFLEVFNIEQNKAVERYKKQLQVIEREDENGEKNYFIGTFQSDKLKRLTPYRSNKEELAQQLKKQQKQYREQKQEQTLARQREEEN